MNSKRRNITFIFTVLLSATVLFSACKKDKLAVTPIEVPTVPSEPGYTGCQTKSFLINVDSAWNDPQQMGRVFNLCDCDTLRVEITNVPFGHWFSDWAIIEPNNIYWSNDIVIDSITTEKYLAAFIDDGFSGWTVDLTANFENCD